MADRLRYLTPRATAVAQWVLLLMPAVSVASVQPAPEVTVRFAVFSAEPIEGVAFMPKPEAPAASLVFYPTARSRRYTYQGDNPLRFYRVPAIPTTPDGPKEVLAEVKIPPGMQEVLLLFLPAAALGGPQPAYRIYLIDDAVTRHAPGTIRIVNLSGLPLNGVIAGREIAVHEGVNPPIRAGLSATVVLRTMFRGRSYPSYADAIAPGRNERALLFLLPPYRPGSLEVQSRLLADQAGEIERTDR